VSTSSKYREQYFLCVHRHGLSSSINPGVQVGGGSVGLSGLSDGITTRW